MDKKGMITASELHRAAGRMLKRVALANEHLVVERNGYPIAVLMPYQEYESLMQLRALSSHRELVRAIDREAEKQGLNEDQLEAELKEDKRIIFGETYGADRS